MIDATQKTYMKKGLGNGIRDLDLTVRKTRERNERSRQYEVMKDPGPKEASSPKQYVRGKHLTMTKWIGKSNHWTP